MISKFGDGTKRIFLALKKSLITDMANKV